MCPVTYVARIQPIPAVSVQHTAQNVDTAENGRDTLAHDFPIF